MRSQCWFDLDVDWIEENFSTREPDFYKKIFKAHSQVTRPKKYYNKFKWFQVPIGNSKYVE